MEFRILGALEVRHEDREIVISGAQQRKALAVLLLEEGRTVSMQRLIEALWSGEPPATAQRQVRNIVAAVRRGLAPADPIERSGDGYRLRTEHTDWHDFRREAAQAKRECDDAEVRRLLRRALARWRGPVLAGLDSEFIAAASLGMEEMRIAAYEDLYAAELALGLHREAVGELRSLAAEHPSRQGLSGHLMLALYRSGDCAGALRVYADLGERLADELGIEPDRRLRDLYVAMLREDPSLDLKQEPAETPPEPAPETVSAAPPSADGEAAERAPEPASRTEPAPTFPPAQPLSIAPPPRSLVRLVALALVVCAIGFGTSQDALDLPPPHEGIGLAMSITPPGIPEGPLWTYPALEPGSGVMMVDAGLLVLERSQLRLEVDGEVRWSWPFESRSNPKATVMGRTILLSTSRSIEEPWDIGVMTALDLDTGRMLWKEQGWWPVGIASDNSFIVAYCAQPADGFTGCSLEAVDPRTRSPWWWADFAERSTPVKTSVPYSSPWDQTVTAEYVLVRSYLDTGTSPDERLSVYRADTGEKVSEFDYTGVEGAQVNGGLLMLHKGSTFVEESRCEARVAAYDLRSAELRWERHIDTRADRDERCAPPPTLVGGQLFPATLSESASLVWARNGELQWTVPERSTAQLLADDAFVTTVATSQGIAVWDVWSHEKRWTANEGELMWTRGGTLWVLDRAAVSADCGGMVGYDLQSGESICLPGSLVYLTEDAVVTADDGLWRGWPVDPWG